MGIKEAKEVVRSGKAFYEEALKNAKAEGTRKILQTMKLGSNVFEVYEEFLSEERISDIPELLKPFGALLNKELERNIEEDEVSEADLGTLVELLSTFGGPEDVSLLTENTILNTKQAFDDYKKQTIVNFTKHIGEGFEGLNLFFKEGVELDLGFAFNKDTFAPLVSEGLKGEEIAEFVEGMKDIFGSV